MLNAINIGLAVKPIALAVHAVRDSHHSYHNNSYHSFYGGGIKG